VIILEASDLMHARFRANLEEVDQNAEFAEGHVLGDEHAAMIPENMIGRMLSLDQARRLIGRMAGGTPKRPAPPSVGAGRRRVRRIAR
jgi:hypothetical protein